MKKILIVDDEEINRITLETGLSGIYETFSADNGSAAIKILSSSVEIDAVLLDLNMPDGDGFSVLKFMKQTGIMRNIPVYIVTASTDFGDIQEAFNMGAADVVSKPYNIQILTRRLANTIELYEQRKNLENKVNQKTIEIKSQCNLLVEQMANMVEFRSKESNSHVKKIRCYTQILMQQIVIDYPEYKYLKDDVETISFAACLHDIGKNFIPDAILLKPGKLTAEEFNLMKSHALRGYEHLLSLREIMDTRLYEYSLDIVRHHHERYDGKGYPDNLKGEEISIWSQAAALSDVYDALTSERVYKKAIEHKETVKMITNGECGVFNPKVMETFMKLEKTFDAMREKLNSSSNEFQKRILIIDDSEIDRETLSVILEPYYEVTQVSSGTEGINKLKDGHIHFDGIIVDINMPQLNGFETIKQINQMIPKRTIIFMMSSDSTSENVQKVASVGVNVFLKKPLEPDIILQKLKNALKIAPVGDIQST